MMKRNSLKKNLSVICVFVLIAAMALNITGCANKKEVPAEPTATVQPQNQAEASVLGEGSKVFTFVAVDLEGKETHYEIHTDVETVGKALLDNGLIAGDEGDYGLYVKTVNGITLDWDKDAKYWSFLIDGEYAMTGCDMTDITEGSVYTFLPAE